jgi:hypothetical protein
MEPKDPEYRNRKLLDLAHRLDAVCGNCGREGPCEPAHSNMAVHGKGGARKAHDCFHAHLCAACHRWLDQGTGRDPTNIYTSERADRQLMFRRAMDVTLLRLWRDGLIQVTR